MLLEKGSCQHNSSAVARNKISYSTKWITVYQNGRSRWQLVTSGNNLLMSALVGQEVLDLLDGHLADVEVLLVTKHRLETPSALLIPKIGRIL